MLLLMRMLVLLCPCEYARPLSLKDLHSQRESALYLADHDFGQICMAVCYL
jgi:hypothetical protein